MTGLDRLRGYARRMDELHVWPGGARLLDIAGQIERERNVCDREEHEAASWVREHGGLDAVRSEWSGRVPYDKHEQRRQRLLGHIAECETALRRRNARIEELGHRVSDLTAENAELRRRAMPEGIERPRFEDGEPVRVGGVVVDEAEELVYRVSEIAFSDGYGTCLRYEDPRDGNSYNFIDGLESGQCVRRPEPKVLDGDGVEAEVGDDLYSVEGMLKFHVSAIDRKNGRIATEAMFALDKWADPKMYTHRAPVIAADGRPLREEEHVYHVETGTELVVKKLPKPGEYQAVVVLVLPVGHIMSFDPDLLTHERPDTWERIEADVMVDAKDYCESRGIRPEYPKHNGKAKCEDIVRRCRALAERGE